MGYFSTINTSSGNTLSVRYIGIAMVGSIAVFIVGAELIIRELRDYCSHLQPPAPDDISIVHNVHAGVTKGRRVAGKRFRCV